VQRIAGRRLIDYAIAATVVVVLVVGGWLAYSMWSNSRAVASSTPAARAVGNLEAAVDKKPKDLTLRIQYAQALSAAGRNREAVEQYRTVLREKKDHLGALTGLGFVALKQQEWKTGEGYWRKAVDILEKSPSATDGRLEAAYFYLGTSLMEQKDYEEAASYFKESLRLRRDASDTHYALAVCFRELGNDQKYREELDITLAFDPKMPEANYDMAQLLLAEGQTANAAELLRTAVDEAPGVDLPADALDELGPLEDRIAAARASKDASAAVSEARIAVAIEPRSVEALRVLATSLEKVGNRTAAADAYRRLLAVAPGDTSATAALKRVTDGK